MRWPWQQVSFGGAFATIAAAFVCVAGAAALSGCGSCDSIVRQTSMPVVAGGSLDGVEVDQAHHRVFFADSAQNAIDVVDTAGSKPRLLGTVAVPAPPKGLAFAPGLNRLYAGLEGGKVAVLDANPPPGQYLRMVDQVTVDTAHSDLLDYSAATHSLYVSTDVSNAIVVIDVADDKVTKRIDLGAPVEQPRYNPADRKLYVNVPALDALMQVDPASGRVTRKYVQQHCHPAGLGINPQRQLAILACRGSVVTFNLRTGLDEISTVVPGGDLVAYDAAVDRFTVGSSHGPRDSSVGVFGGDGRFIGQVQSSSNAHGAVFDDSSGLVYAASGVGILSFSPSACAPPPDWLAFVGGLSLFVLPLAAFGAFLAWYARRRRDPNRPRRPTAEELAREDLVAERERIRALEDAIYGPEGG